MEKICPHKHKLIIAIGFGKSESVEKKFQVSSFKFKVASPWNN